MAAAKDLSKIEVKDEHISEAKKPQIAKILATLDEAPPVENPTFNAARTRQRAIAFFGLPTIAKIISIATILGPRPAKRFALMAKEKADAAKALLTNVDYNSKASTMKEYEFSLSRLLAAFPEMALGAHIKYGQDQVGIKSRIHPILRFSNAPALIPEGYDELLKAVIQYQMLYSDVINVQKSESQRMGAQAQTQMIAAKQWRNSQFTTAERIEILNVALAKFNSLIDAGQTTLPCDASIKKLNWSEFLPEQPKQ